MLALKGLFLALLSGFIFSVAGVIVKDVKNVHQVELAMIRFIGLFTLSLPQVVYCREELYPKGYRYLFLLRGLLGTTGLVLSFMAFRYLPLGEASVIMFSSPVFVVILARIFLKEKCGLLQVVALVTTVLGLVLISKIPFAASKATVYTREYVYGLLAAFGAVFVETSRIIILRKLKGVHEAIVMLNYGWIAVLCTVAATAIMGEFRALLCGLQPWMMIGLGVLSYLDQLLLTLATQADQAGPVATARAATSIVSAFFWQTLLFRDLPGIWSVVGALVVSCSVVLVGLRKWILSLPPDSKALRYLGWLKA